MPNNEDGSVTLAVGALVTKLTRHHLAHGGEVVGVELSGFNIVDEVDNSDLARPIAVALQASAQANGATFHRKKS